MILRSQLITLNQVIIGIGKTTNSLIVRVVCNVGLTVRVLHYSDIALTARKARTGMNGWKIAPVTTIHTRPDL